MTSSKTIYVAGASREIDTVEHYMTELRRAGWTIAEDWCANMRVVATPDHQLSIGEQREHARRNTRAILYASHLWLIVPETHSDGAWFELGYAICAADEWPRRRVIVSGRSSLFTSLADQRFERHADALCALTNREAA
jgi:hypothetical protein